MGRRSRTFAVLLVVAAIAVFLLFFGVGPRPDIEIAPEIPGIGRSTAVEIRVSEPRRGVGRVEVRLEQGERGETIFEASFEHRPLWKPWAGVRTAIEESVRLGREHQEWLAEGEAGVVVEASRASPPLRAVPAARESVTLEVDLTPPILERLSTQTYVEQGGAEAVVYRVGDEAVRHGVEAGADFFPGAPLPGSGEDRSFAFFSAPWDLDGDGDDILLVAEDRLGNRVAVPFVDRFTPHPVRRGTIRLTDGFLRKVVPAIAARTPEIDADGELLETYLEINGPLRAANRATIASLAAESRAELLWSEPFLALPNGQVMSPFAERRTYLYRGEEVDEQVHLGFDLASVRRAPVPAANDGVIAFAGYLGIYGNVVVVDHGFGLMTLSAHLSSMEVEAGEPVVRGQEIGRTGETGLAGGDHLHFAVLLHGVPVTPVEWWDGHWIADRIGRKLGDALPLSTTGGPS